MRLHQPIGLLLLLWPTLWALWLASHGVPDMKLLIIFMLGVVVMRSAGCIVNDLADRDIDGHVARTKMRPLVQGDVTATEALVLAGCLSLIGFFLVLFCNTYTILLSFVGLSLAIIYPFLKRLTHVPQFGLGLAFNSGIPMAFVAVNNELIPEVWFVFACAMVWTLIYDTIYAMVDRIDDKRIGVKSTAILFNTSDKLVVGLLQLGLMMMLIKLGLLFQLGFIYFLLLVPVGASFIYQQWLIKDRHRDRCLIAFKHNHWVGMFIFMGILLSCAL